MHNTFEKKCTVLMWLMKSRIYCKCLTRFNINNHALISCCPPTIRRHYSLQFTFALTKYSML